MKLKLLTTLFALAFIAAQAVDGARIKDLTSVKGARDNQLRGVGLVVGLAGQGDGKIEPTEQSIINAMKRFGLDISRADKSRNVAVVIVTADIGPYAKEGSRIDVTVSSFGDAESLQGGILLQTPLAGADEGVYAVAQGPVAVGGFLGGNAQQGATIQINHPTVGQITNGAIVEQEIPFEIVGPNGTLDLLMKNPDATTAARIANAINNFYPASSLATDFGTVNVRVPGFFRGQETNFLASIGGVDVMPDVPARIIINERTGTIVATQNVRISTSAAVSGASDPRPAHHRPERPRRHHPRDDLHPTGYEERRSLTRRTHPQLIFIPMSNIATLASISPSAIPQWAQGTGQPKSDLPRIKTEEAKIAEVSRQFEAIILRNFLKDSLKPVFKTYLNQENSQNSIYRYHLVDSLAESMSQREALGISTMLQMQLKSTLSSKGSTEVAK